MNRRRLFALAGGSAATVSLPAIAAPVVEMHENDVARIPHAVATHWADYEDLRVERFASHSRFKPGDRFYHDGREWIIQAVYNGS